MVSEAKIYLLSIFLSGVLISTGWADDPNDDHAEIARFMKYYYLDPEPNELSSVLKNCLKSQIWPQDEEFNEHAEYLVAYFFARAGRSQPDLINNCLEFFESGNHRQRLFILKILQLCGDQRVMEFFTTKLDAGRYTNEAMQIRLALEDGIPLDFSPLNEPIKHPSDLDFLWIEFAVTGDEEPVGKIINSLSGPNDISDANAINIIIQRAKWTLTVNCKSYDKVLQICKDELAALDNSIRIALEEIIDSADGSISMRKMIKQGCEEKPVMAAKAWALGCSAVLIEYNHGRHDYLSPNKINERNIKMNRELLEEWWGIKNKGDLLSDLSWLRLEGHRSKFVGWGLLIQNLSEQEYKELLQKYQGDKNELQRIRVTKEYYEELGVKGLLGWDYTRYICLCRWGYLSAYISEEEAWEKIMPIARMLQKNFDSWEDLGRNYLIGRQFWSYEQTQDSGYLFEDAYQRLIDMPSSPWNKFSWDMDLTGAESICEPSEAEPNSLVYGEYTK